MSASLALRALEELKTRSRTESLHRLFDTSAGLAELKIYLEDVVSRSYALPTDPEADEARERLKETIRKLDSYPISDVVRKEFKLKYAERLPELFGVADMRELPAESFNEQRPRIRAFIDRVAHERRLPHSIAFDFVMTESPNALAFHFKTDDSYAIAVDPRLLAFFGTLLISAFDASAGFQTGTYTMDESLSKFIRACYMETDLFFRGNPPEDIDETDEIALLDSLSEITGEPIKTLIALVDHTIDLAWIFILLHELGHIALGHFEEEDTPPLQVLGEKEARTSIFMQEREFLADQWALRTLVEVEKTNKIPAVILRAISACTLALTGIIEYIHEPDLELGKLLWRSHPPADSRVRRLKEALQTEGIGGGGFFAQLADLPDYILAVILSPKLRLIDANGDISPTQQ